MTPETCPGCGAKLEPDMPACPSCPMSFPEDEPSSGIHPLRQTKAYAFLMPALFFAAMGLGVWYLAMGLMRLGEGGDIPVQYQNVIASTPTVSGSPSTPSGSSGEGEEEYGPGAVGIMVPTAEDVAAAPAVPEKKRKPVKEWRLRGRVYDLSTLRPVAGCALVFVDETENRRIETRSSADGSYKVVVPPLADRGYMATITKPGYAPAYLNPGTEGVREMSFARRLEVSKELSATVAAPFPVQAYDERPLVTDFYLAPRP